MKMPETQGVKHDQGKPSIGLIPTEAVVEIAKVFDFGAIKYSPHNWRGGFAYSRLFNAALRHVFSYIAGEDKDPESGLSHLAHACCCLMMLITHVVKKYGKDDRYRE